MSLEVGTYIDDLVETNPLPGDARSEGDDHIRLVKSVLKNTFPNISGVVNPTPTELNHLVGVTSGLQAQIDALDEAKASMPAATVTVFYQAAAPTGWTKVTTQNNKALRVVSGTGGVTGNDAGVNFTAAFASKSVTGVVGGHALTWNEMPAHTHGGVPVRQQDSDRGGAASNFSLDSGTTETFSSGSGWEHTHTFAGTAINMAVQYIDIIMASRNP